MIAENLQWIKEGLYVDAKDKRGSWQVGLILSISKNLIKVRFDGWTSKDDQFYQLNSQRIKPFRSITKGYTGQKKYTGCRQHWIFSIQNLQSRLQKFEEFVSHISQKSALEINQYLRGQNYFYIDYLLSWVYDKSQQIIKVYSYFKTFLQFVKSYFDQFVQRDLNHWFEAADQQQLSAKKVYSELHFELFQSICQILGSHPRTNIFIKSNDKLLRQMNGDTPYDVFITKQLNNIQLLTKFQQVTAKMYNQTLAGVRSIPFCFINSMLNLYIGLEKLPLPAQFKRKVTVNLIYVVQEYMKSLSIQQVKQSQKSIQQMLLSMRVFCNKIPTQKEEILKWLQNSKLKIGLYLIQCDVLEKKLRGINKIKEFYDLVDRKLANPLENYSIICSKNQFRQWMDQERLLQIIFQNNQHSEVIKKGCEMIQYFYGSKFQLCPIEEVVYIWNTCFKKHEAIKKIIFQFWIDIVENLNKEHDWRQFTRVLLQNQYQMNQDWQIESLLMLLNAIKYQQRWGSQIEKIVDLIYRKILLNKKFINQLAKELGQKLNIKLLKKMMDNCVKKVKQKNQQLFHYKLIYKLLSQQHKNQTYIPQNIINFLIEQIKLYINDTDNQKLIILIFNIFNQIMQKGNFVNESGVKFTFQHFETLWNIFYHGSISHLKKNFFQWMVMKNASSSPIISYTINHRLSSDLKLELFSNILCDSTKINYKRMDHQEFILFKELFIFANIKASFLDIKLTSLINKQHRRILRVKSKYLHGLQQLWEIFKISENQDVIALASTFLKDLYLRTSTMMSREDITERIQNLMENIRAFIIEGQKQGQYFLIKKTLILMTKLMTDIKQKIQIPKQYQRYQKSQITTIEVFTGFSNETKKLQIYVEQPFVNIKSMIAQKFQLNKDEFTLINGKSQVHKQQYDLPYFLHNFSDCCFRLQRISNDASKYIMAFIQNFSLQIIQFLKNDHICTEAYNLLGYLDISQSDRLFKNLSNQIQEVHQLIKNKKKLYLHIYFLKVFANLIEKSDEVQADVFFKLIPHLEIHIQNYLIINYLEKLVGIMLSISRKILRFQERFDSSQSEIQILDIRPNIYKLLLNLVQYLNKHSSSITYHEINLFNNSIDLYGVGFKTAKETFSSFIKDPSFTQLIYQVFIKCEVFQIKKTLSKRFQIWLKDGFATKQQQLKVTRIFIKDIYCQIWNISQKRQIKCNEFSGAFKIFRTILETISQDVYRQIMSENFSDFNHEMFSTHIYSSISYQSDSSISCNYMLNGQLQIFAGMIKKDRSLISPSTIEYLLFDCLLYVPGRTKVGQVKCLFKQNINIVLQILWYTMVNVQIKNEPQNSKTLYLQIGEYTENILVELEKFHYDESWRDSKKWRIDFIPLSKTKYDFVGLQNPGCICYLNSLLQQLFMIQKFKSAILNMKNFQPSQLTSEKVLSQNNQTQTLNEQQDSPDLIPNLKLLFLKLMYSQHQAIDPQFFTSSIKQGNKSMVKIYEQMDIDQFSMILFDKIQNQLHRKQTPNFIRELFGGTYSNQIISKQCHHSSEREEHFLSISLDVKKHITESFQSLVKGELLEGENSYFCDGCDKKVKALKRLSIKRLPPHLIISLRRFQFDFEIDQKIKINKYCQFPFELNLQNYSQSKLNQLNDLSKKSQNSMNFEQPFNQQNSPLFPPQYYIYKLKGVVIHTGSADSGHYYSFIESENGKWFEFNDDKVSEFDIKNLEEEAFGGKEGEHIRIKNAYLLFYERKSKVWFDNHTCTVNNGKEQTNILPEQSLQLGRTQNYFKQPLSQSFRQAFEDLICKERTVQLDKNRVIIEEIAMQNKKARICALFLSKQYLEFVMSFLIQAVSVVYKIQFNDYIKPYQGYEYIMPFDQVQTISFSKTLISNHRLEFQIFKFMVSNAFFIQLRHKNSLASLEIFKLVVLIYYEHPMKERRAFFIQYILKEICQQSFINEFFLSEIPKDKSKIVGNFINETIVHRLLMAKNEGKDKIPDLILKFIKIIIKTVITTSVNIQELLLIIRKIFTLNQFHGFNTESILYFMIKQDFCTVLVGNMIGPANSFDIKCKRLLYLSKQEPYPIQSEKFLQPSSQQNNQNVEVKQLTDQINASEGSAKMQFEANQNQINNISRFFYQTSQNGLFANYQQEICKPVRAGEKQTWLILWEVKKMMRLKKNIINDMNQNSIALMRNDMNYNSTAFMRNNSPQIQMEYEKKLEHEKAVLPQQLYQINSPNGEKLVSPPSFILNPKFSVESSPERKNQTLQPEYDHSDGTSDSGSEEALDSSGDDQGYQMINNVIQNEFENKANNVNTHNIETNNQTNTLTNPKKITDKKSSQRNSPQQSNHFPRKINGTEQKVLQIQNQQKDIDFAEIQAVPASQNPIQSEFKNKLNELLSLYYELNHRLSISFNKIRSNFLLKHISGLNDTKTIVAMAVFISEMVYENAVFCQTVLNVIQLAFKDYSSTMYRPFFIVTEKLIELEDSFTKQRRQQIIRIFRSAIRVNESHFIETDLIHQYLLRYCAKYPGFQAIFRENINLISQIKVWLSQKRYPLPESIKKHCQPSFERHAYRQHGITVSGEMKVYHEMNQYKYESFQRIRQRRFNSLVKYTDDPKPGQIYFKGDIVQFFYEDWITLTVEQTYFGFVSIVFPYTNRTERQFFYEDDEKFKLKKRCNQNKKVQQQKDLKNQQH